MAAVTVACAEPVNVLYERFHHALNAPFTDERLSPAELQVVVERARTTMRDADQRYPLELVRRATREIAAQDIDEMDKMLHTVRMLGVLVTMMSDGTVDHPDQEAHRMYAEACAAAKLALKAMQMVSQKCNEEPPLDNTTTHVHISSASNLAPINDVLPSVEALYEAYSATPAVAAADNLEAVHAASLEELGSLVLPAGPHRMPMRAALLRRKHAHYEEWPADLGATCVMDAFLAEVCAREADRDRHVAAVAREAVDDCTLYEERLWSAVDDCTRDEVRPWSLTWHVEEYICMQWADVVLAPYNLDDEWVAIAAYPTAQPPTMAIYDPRVGSYEAARLTADLVVPVVAELLARLRALTGYVGTHVDSANRPDASDNGSDDGSDNRIEGIAYAVKTYVFPGPDTMQYAAAALSFFGSVDAQDLPAYLSEDTFAGIAEESL